MICLSKWFSNWGQRHSRGRERGGKEEREQYIQIDGCDLVAVLSFKVIFK